MYSILPYSYKKAKELNVKIIPSKKLNKKIDILDLNGKYICSIGDIKYDDYFTFLKKYGNEYADNRRRLYIIRHKKDIGKIGSAGYYSYIILWNG